MSITVLAIGDPHFQVNNVTETEELISKINLVVEDLQPTFVVILGDLLHTHEKIHVTPFNLATKLITSLSKKVQVFLLIGNHDLINNQQFLTNKHAFNAFKKIDNVVVCDKVVVKIINDKKYVFCPYVPPKRFQEALDTVYVKGQEWADAECIFAHQEFFGCRFNPIMTSTEGDEWPSEYPLVISGHIHDEQWLQDNIYYTGSSMQHAFGESSKKTIAHLTFSENEKCILKKINLEMRKKKIVYITIDNAKTFIPPENTLIKLVVKGFPEEIKLFRTSKEYKHLQQLGIAISFQFNETDKPEIERVEKKSVLTILKELVKNENKHVQKALKDMLKGHAVP